MSLPYAAPKQIQLKFEDQDHLRVDETSGTSKIGVGQHNISATYSGDAKHARNSRTIKQTVK
jgi:hypothetical protein